MKRLQDILDESAELEEVQLDEAAFWRLPGHAIGNELYSAMGELKAFYQSMIAGNDFDPKRFNNIIKDLQFVKKEAKKFNNIEDVPTSYQYKSGTIRK